VLVVEILSPTTHLRDRNQKRTLYRDEARVAEYWMVDAREKSITVIRPGEHDRVVTDRLVWSPPGSTEPLVVGITRVFESTAADPE
jgi:Uma2 family endonuclease